MSYFQHTLISDHMVEQLKDTVDELKNTDHDRARHREESLVPFIIYYINIMNIHSTFKYNCIINFQYCVEL